MTLLRIRDAERVTLKSYRMGKASSLAVDGGVAAGDPRVGRVAVEGGAELPPA